MQGSSACVGSRFDVRSGVEERCDDRQFSRCRGRMQRSQPVGVRGFIYFNFEYVRGRVHTNNIEGYWSSVKRGIYGNFYKVSDKYLQMYLDEFDFRFNSRDVSDSEMFQRLLGQTSGKRLIWYCRTPQEANPFANLVRPQFQEYAS